LLKSLKDQVSVKDAWELNDCGEVKKKLLAFSWQILVCCHHTGDRSRPGHLGRWGSQAPPSMKGPGLAPPGRCPHTTPEYGRARHCPPVKYTQNIGLVSNKSSNYRYRK